MELATSKSADCKAWTRMGLVMADIIPAETQRILMASEMSAVIPTIIGGGTLFSRQNFNICLVAVIPSTSGTKKTS